MMMQPWEAEDGDGGGGGEDVDDGVLRLRSPATPERIRLACEDPIMRRARVVPRDGEEGFFVEI